MPKVITRSCFGLLILALSAWTLAATAQDSTSTAKNSTTTVTGCIAKGQEANGFTLTDSNGKVWELFGHAVNLSDHVGHKVTLTGRERSASQAKEAKLQPTEMKESNGKANSDLWVKSLKMVSESCQ
jgi:hypothetical protein